MKSSRPIQTPPEAEAASKLDRFEVVDLGSFDNNRNDVHAVNDSGQYAGVCLNQETGRIEAFLEENGIRSMLGTLGGSFSIARDLNNRGEVVGGSLTEGDENFHAFLYHNNRVYDLNQLVEAGSGWEILQAVCINNHGEILAIGSHTGQDHIVLLRPRATATASSEQVQGELECP
jgi:probable HAF family extracellular repeat protein